MTHDCIIRIVQVCVPNTSSRGGGAASLPGADRRRGVYVEGLTEWIVRSPQDAFGLIDEGGKQRMTGTTRMSELSSRSHAIFTIVCEQVRLTLAPSPPPISHRPPLVGGLQVRGVGDHPPWWGCMRPKTKNVLIQINSNSN